MGTEDPESPRVGDGGKVDATRMWSPGDGAPTPPVGGSEGPHARSGEGGPSAEATILAARMHGVFAPGSRFGVYVVGTCIGEGGMARIYRAEHAGLRRQVALKVLIHGFSRDSEGRERFVREARIAAAIKHPNVVNIFDVGVHENIPYLVMELLEGTDLEAMIASRGALDENLILDIMVPVVAGLSAVHDAGIVHRDLKPGNIFLSKGRYEDLEPKLLDFGISKAPDPGQPRITNLGHLMGTPFYMSPEGVRGGEITPLSDQYSLAVVMYECATGRAPYVESNLHDLVQMISAGSYRPPDVCNPKVSKRLASIITRAMSLDPARRFPDLRAMGRELLSLAGQRTRITWGLSFGHLSPKAEGPAPAPIGAVEPAQVPRRRSLVATIMPFALAALGVSIAFAFYGIWSLSVSTKPRWQSTGSQTTTAPALTTQSPEMRAPGPEGEQVSSAAVVTAQPTPPGSSPALPSPRSPTPSVVSSRKSRRGSRASSPAEVRRLQPSSGETPDWAIPVAIPAAPQARIRDIPPQQNSNGAPLFD
jgi:serine/threonine protein kinase